MSTDMDHQGQSTARARGNLEIDLRGPWIERSQARELHFGRQSADSCGHLVCRGYRFP